MTRTESVGWAIVSATPQVAAPLRAVDTWCAAPDGDRLILTATLAVPSGDAHLRGHFPGLAVLPGVFVIEALTQLMRHATGREGDPGAPVLRTLRSVRFFAPLLDGDELTLRAEATPQPAGWAVKAVGRRSDGTVSARIRADFTGGK